MRLLQNVDKDIKATKAELYRLEAKLERLREERGEILDKIMESV